MQPNRLAVSVNEGAAMIGIAGRTMRAWISVGRVRAVRLGRRVVIPVRELERLIALDELPVETKSAACEAADIEQLGEKTDESDYHMPS